MTAVMNAEQAEHRFRELEAQYQARALDENTYRIEAAKLLWRDTHGAFWMPDVETGGWFCNAGDGWAPGDPRAEPLLQAAQPGMRAPRSRRLSRLVLAGALVLALLGVAAAIVWLQNPLAVRDLIPLAPTDAPGIQVTIASPADGSQAALGQVVAIETSIAGSPDLRDVTRVEFRVNGQLIASQPVQAKIQAGQTSLPLSQPWRPVALGDYQLMVTVYSAEDIPLGRANLSLNVVDTPDVLLPEAACTPEATFAGDVTIPAGTAFRPGARMDKVWQVRNTGSCAWGVGYELVLVDGDDLGAPHAVPVPATASDAMADLAVTFWAPAEAGSFSSVWQLQAPDGQFFGPTLPLNIEVQAQAIKTLPPEAPANLSAEVAADGKGVRLTWDDLSDDEDAFRIYRQDVEASIGLAPANVEEFVDLDVACGHSYSYSVVAFNAAGMSDRSEEAQLTLPPCALPADVPPDLILTIVPTRVNASETFTVVFQATDDAGVAWVEVQGQDTGDPVMDAGRTFTCTMRICTGLWPLVWTTEVSTTYPLTLTAVAQDSTGQQSDPARTTVSVLPPE